MAHEFETGFFVREPAWHGLGTVVENAPSSAEAIKLAGLDWTVGQSPVIVNGLEVPHYKANIRSTDNSVLGIVSDRYRIVQNTEAFDFTDALLGEGVKYETAGSLKDGKTIWLLAKMDTVKILGDEVEPYMCFSNTHDGTGAVKVCMTPTRVVCNNTLNFALKTASRSWSTKHMGDINAKMYEARNTLGLANYYMDNLKKEAELLASQKIDKDKISEILDDLFGKDLADTDRKKKNIEEAKTEYLEVYCIMPDLANFFGTKYGFLNAMADMVDHREPSRQTQNYAENNFARVVNGHALLDGLYERVKSV